MIEGEKRKASRLKSDNYLYLIEEWRKRKSFLSEEKIKDLVKANKLQTLYGIDERDVINDINTLDIDSLRKNKQKVRASQLYPIKKKSSEEDNNIQHDNNTVFNGIDRRDEELSNLIYSLIRKYPDLLADNKRLKNALGDVIIEKKMELNLLRILIDCGILDEIRRVTELDNALRHRISNKLIMNYGVNPDAANRMVIIWFYAYGKKLLKKTID